MESNLLRYKLAATHQTMILRVGIYSPRPEVFKPSDDRLPYASKTHFKLVKPQLSKT